MHMLADKKIKAFAPTVNPEKAKAFYQNVLGLELMSEDGFALQFNCSGTCLRVTTVRELTPHPFTVLGWTVPVIEETVKELTDKGVVFERYGFLQQDAWGIWTAPGGTKVAWFKDPDGNLLSLDC